MASTLAAPSLNGTGGGSSGKHKSCSSIASSLFGGSKHHQAPAAPSNSTSRKSSTKEKRWRQKEDERVEKLRLLVSYLRNGSSQQLLVKPVKLEADEIELAQRYKSLPTLCENCLKSVELQQPLMDPMPNHHNQHQVAPTTGSISSCSIMNLTGACDATGSGLYHHAGAGGGSGSNYSSCSRTPDIGWNQSISGCSSHRQLNASQSSVGIVINVRRSSEQSECLASASDTDSHHNQQLTSAESDQTGSTYSGSSGSTTNLQASAIMSDLAGSHVAGSVLSTAGLPTPLLASSATINGPSSSSIYHQSTPKMFYIGDHERRDGCTWTNPPNLATWIDNEVNSLVNDLEAKSQLAKSEKLMKNSKRKWLPTSGSNRRSSSGAQST